MIIDCDMFSNMTLHVTKHITKNLVLFVGCSAYNNIRKVVIPLGLDE